MTTALLNSPDLSMIEQIIKSMPKSSRVADRPIANQTMAAAISEQERSSSTARYDVVGASTAVGKRGGAGEYHDWKVRRGLGMSKQSVCPLLS